MPELAVRKPRALLPASPGHREPRADARRSRAPRLRRRFSGESEAAAQRYERLGTAGSATADRPPPGRNRTSMPAAANRIASLYTTLGGVCYAHTERKRGPAQAMLRAPPPDAVSTSGRGAAGPGAYRRLWLCWPRGTGGTAHGVADSSSTSGGALRPISRTPGAHRAQVKHRGLDVPRGGTMWIFLERKALCSLLGGTPAARGKPSSDSSAVGEGVRRCLQISYCTKSYS